MLVGDFSKGTVNSLNGVLVEIGTLNNQFRENKFTVLAEERLLLLVRQTDQAGFVKVTNIANAVSGLTNS